MDKTMLPALNGLIESRSVAEAATFAQKAEDELDSRIETSIAATRHFLVVLEGKTALLAEGMRDSSVVEMIRQSVTKLRQKGERVLLDDGLKQRIQLQVDVFWRNFDLLKEFEKKDVIDVDDQIAEELLNAQLVEHCSEGITLSSDGIWLLHRVSVVLARPIESHNEVRKAAGFGEELALDRIQVESPLLMLKLDGLSRMIGLG